MPRSLTPAERAISDAMAFVEEMPDDMDLAVALSLLGNARARVAAFVARQERESDTEPAPPPSTRSEQPTIPDGAQ